MDWKERFDFICVIFAIIYRDRIEEKFPEYFTNVLNRSQGLLYDHIFLFQRTSQDISHFWCHQSKIPHDEEPGILISCFPMFNTISLMISQVWHFDVASDIQNDTFAIVLAKMI